MSAAQKKVMPMTDLRLLLKGSLAAAIDVVDASTHQGPIQSSRAIVTSESLDMTRVLNWKLDRGANHICQTDSGAIEQEMNTSALMLKNPDLFMDFPIGSILTPDVVTPESSRALTKMAFRFQKGTQKTQMIEQLRQTLLKMGRPGSIIANSVLIADEMFTNAIFNAPFVDPKSGFNPGIDRSDWSVEMNTGQYGELLLGHDEDRLVIACRDPFGSMEIRHLLTRIRDCCLEGISANMKMGVGGAGIGSFMVFNASSSFYVGVQPGKCTVVAAAIHWKWGGKRRDQATKNLHCIQY